MTDQQTTPHYFPGLSLDLRLLDGTGDASDSIIRAHVTKVFLPFTKSQVMRITLPAEPGSKFKFPQNAVLKLYDRRWIDDRRDHPWSPSRETAAQAAWSEKRWGVETLDDDDSEFYYGDDSDSSENSDSVEASDLDDSENTSSRSGKCSRGDSGGIGDSGDIGNSGGSGGSDEIDDAEWEEHYRQMVQTRFRTEAEAYTRLSDMQGSIIPRCYASVQVMLPDSQIHEASVYGLILEVIDAVDLTKFDPLTGNYASLGHALMAAIYTFPSYGVLHRDIRSQNILISSARIVIIDFGQALLRKAGLSDDKWKKRIKYEDEVEALRLILNNRHIRDHSPFDSRQTVPETSCGGFNATVRQFSEEWKRQWYHKVPLTGDDRVKGLEWIAKDNVIAWLDSRPPPPQCFLIPRPGSPDSHAPKLEFALHSN